MKVIIDNGHGSNTKGKRSPKWEDSPQLLEFEFNRDIAKRLKSELDLNGIESVLLVPEEEDISLSERCKRANDIYSEDKNSFLISIHANAANGSANGWEAHIATTASIKSKLLATKFYDEAMNEKHKIKTRSPLGNNSPWMSRFYILLNTHCPAILTENMFMDNKEDCNYILSEKGRKEIVEIHLSAILKYINNPI